MSKEHENNSVEPDPQDQQVTNESDGTVAPAAGAHDSAGLVVPGSRDDHENVASASNGRAGSKKKRKKAKRKAKKLARKAAGGKKFRGLDWVATAESVRAVERGVGSRPLGLVVIRESDEWDLEMFNAMREMTYQNLRHLPAVEAVRAVGLSPLDADSFQVLWEVDGETVTREVMVSRIRHGDTKAVLFFFEGYWHLWSQASAAKVSEFGYNNFTRILTEQIERLCPVTVYAANLSRLIRSEREASRLADALRDRVDVLDARDQRFNLLGKDAWVGFMMLTIMGWCASSERTAIVQRLLAGRVSQWRRNEWPLGAGVVPFGYTFDKKTKQLVVDVSKRDAVREMLIILCSDAPPSQKAVELDRVGVRSFRRDPKTNQYKPLSARVNAEQAIRTLLMWAPVWVAGEYLHRYTNPLGDLDELSGLKVVRFPRDKKDPGELQMLFKLGTPEGGWAEPELLQAFALKATSLASRLLESGDCNSPRPLAVTVADYSDDADLLRGLLSPEMLNRMDGKTVSRRHAARAHKTIRPFMGRNWIDGDWFYELQASSAKSYRIIRWPVSSMDPAVDPELRQHQRDGGM
ncbi:hypothetical protein [Aeromicrobium sp. 9AM]|uniref:hypothetical protein n=1 Tax=Aeromicrobium sp. 9AM TaxID=2653126 RepID=UPI0013587E34|nr:hypothetical protein [Aeromicrobium sp. 9AM]